MPKPMRLIAAIAAMATGSVLTGCVAPPLESLRSAPAMPEPAHMVRIKTIDYGFIMPPTVPAGPVTLHFENAGNEMHHAIIAQVNPGTSEDDVLEILHQSPLLLIKVASTVGAVGDMLRGGHAEATLSLHHGKHVVVCYVPSLDGRLHASKGMIGFFDVVTQ